MLFRSHVVLSAFGAKKAIPALIKAVLKGLSAVVGAIVAGSFRLLGEGLRTAWRELTRALRGNDGG